MIRLGIVGSNYGRTVQLPAFRADARCQVVALAGSDAARTAELAHAANVPKAYGDWRALVEDADVEAVAIATLAQPAGRRSRSALWSWASRSSPKSRSPPTSPPRAPCCKRPKKAAGRPWSISNFTQILSWQRAKEMLDTGAIGRLRHITVHWHVENRAVQERLRNWKTRRQRRRRARQFHLALLLLSGMVCRPDRRPVGAGLRPARRAGFRDDRRDGAAIRVGRCLRACR